MFQSYRARLCGMAALLTLCWATAQAGAADLKYLPEDTEMVLTINFRQMMDEGFTARGVELGKHIVEEQHGDVAGVLDQ